MIKVVNFDQIIPILQANFPEKCRHFPIDLSLGQVEWSATELSRTDPHHYMYYHGDNPVACMSLFRASDEVSAIHNMASCVPINNGEWKDIFDFAKKQIYKWQSKKIYCAFKSKDQEIMRYIGFTQFDGPYLTHDWHIMMAWKDLHDRNRFGDKHIADDIDGEGNPLKIWYSEKVGGSKAAYLIAKVYSELLEKDWSGPYANFEDIYKNCNVVYSTDLQGNVLGGMVFEYRHAGREGFQHLNFVDPSARGRRISSVSRKYHRILIKQKGGNKISSTIMVDNGPSFKTALRDDMKPVYIRMHKWLY
jgi:hypothetical protein